MSSRGGWCRRDRPRCLRAAPRLPALTPTFADAGPSALLLLRRVKRDYRSVRWWGGIWADLMSHCNCVARTQTHACSRVVGEKARRSSRGDADKGQVSDSPTGCRLGCNLLLPSMWNTGKMLPCCLNEPSCTYLKVKHLLLPARGSLTSSHMQKTCRAIAWRLLFLSVELLMGLKTLIL